MFKFFNKLFIILTIVSFQTYSFSENVNEIELEGMSLNDSLLNFISKNEIKKNIIPYFKDERDYYIVFFNKNLTQYDDFEIYLKTNDNNYEIKGINAGLYPKNLNECLDKMEKISNEISSALEINFFDDSSKHGYYTNSFINGKTAQLDGGYLRIDCMFFDEKDKKVHEGLVDNLAVMLKSNEIEKWFQSGYK